MNLSPVSLPPVETVPYIPRSFLYSFYFGRRLSFPSLHTYILCDIRVSLWSGGNSSRAFHPAILRSQTGKIRAKCGIATKLTSYEKGMTNISLRTIHNIVKWRGEKNKQGYIVFTSILCCSSRNYTHASFILSHHTRERASGNFL